MIPYVRVVNYMSASSLMKLEENPLEFYLRRLGPTEFMPPAEPQGFPAAAGTAFDGMVKSRISSLTGIKCASLGYMIREVTAERDRALEMGGWLVQRYQECGALDSLISTGIESLGATIEDLAPGTQVPIQCKLDASLLVNVPHDWKVKGAGSPGSYSPSPGYSRLICIGVSGRKAKTEPHPRSSEPMDTINPEWATQLALYGWALGRPVAEMRVSIDELVVEEGGLRVAQFRNVVTQPFQLRLLARLEEAWARIKECRVVEPEIAEHEHARDALLWLTSRPLPSIYVR